MVEKLSSRCSSGGPVVRDIALFAVQKQIAAYSPAQKAIEEHSMAAGANTQRVGLIRQITDAELSIWHAAAELLGKQTLSAVAVEADLLLRKQSTSQNAASSLLSTAPAFRQ